MSVLSSMSSSVSHHGLNTFSASVLSSRLFLTSPSSAIEAITAHPPAPAAALTAPLSPAAAAPSNTPLPTTTPPSAPPTPPPPPSPPPSPSRGATLDCFHKRGIAKEGRKEAVLTRAPFGRGGGRKERKATGEKKPSSLFFQTINSFPDPLSHFYWPEFRTNPPIFAWPVSHSH